MRRHLTPPMIVALLALFISLSGTGYAVSQITGKQIKDNTVASVDIRNKSLTAQDFRPDELPAGEDGADGADGQPGPVGPKGDTGGQGPAGPQGDPGPTYNGGNGVAVNGGLISLSGVGCSTGDIRMYNGSSWACSAFPEPAPPSAQEGGGLVSGAQGMGLRRDCSTGYVLKYNSTSWACSPAAVSGNGIAVNGDVISMSGSGCANGDIRRWNGSSWACSALPVPAPYTPNVVVAGPLSDQRLHGGNSAASTWYDIAGRTLTINKQSASTRLRLTYQDTLGVDGGLYDGCVWRIQVGNSTYSQFSAADSDLDQVRWHMDNGAHVAWVSGLAAGNHTVKVQWMGNRGAWGSGTDECMAGWNTTGNFLSAEEI